MMQRASWSSVVTGLVAALALLPGYAEAATPRLCTRGMAQSLFQSAPVTFAAQESRGNLRPRRVDAAHQCQYRVWRGDDDDNHVTFSEDDFFLGGVTYFFDYKAAGVPRKEAIAEMEQGEDRVWLA